MVKLVSKSSDYKWHMDKTILEWLYHDKELSMADMGEVLGVNWATVQQQMNKHDIPRRTRGEITNRTREKLSRSREGIPSWNKGLAGNYEKWTKYGKDAARYNGGRRVVERGYISILRHDHPHKNSSGYVLEHRLVYEEFLGRYLTSEEVIHHRDGNTSNNDLSNLFLFPNNTVHMQFHRYIAQHGTIVSEEQFMKEVYKIDN